MPVTGLGVTTRRLRNLVETTKDKAMEGLEEAANDIVVDVQREVDANNLKWMSPPKIEKNREKLTVKIITPIWCELWALLGITEEKQRIYMKKSKAYKYIRKS